MEEKVINVAEKTDSQLRCPYCNSSQIGFNQQTGKLRCNYCQKEFEGKTVNSVATNVFNLKGQTISKGAANINVDSSNLIAVKCSNCGAEVVIDTNNIANSKCHWCNSVLSITAKIDNGVIPDVILPFKINQNEAYEKAQRFIKQRSFFANRRFKANFKVENMKGVYFPYFIVDSNRHINVSGVGRHITKKREREEGRSTVYICDVDKYNVEREFDIAISNLTIESNTERLMKNSERTNNIINSIMPFDIENCVQFEPHYLNGYTAEKRDVNVEEINSKVNKHCDEIIGTFIEKDTKFYDYGVKYSQGINDEVGSQWLTAYLPVWIYSYQDKENVIHYLAVNARTGETMGSVPLKRAALVLSMIAISVLALAIIITYMMLNPDGDNSVLGILLIMAVVGPVVLYVNIDGKYLNQGARHSYTEDTKYQVTNIRRVDEYVEHEKGLKKY